MSDIQELYTFGVITKAQFLRAQKERVRSFFMTHEGKLVVINAKGTLISITRGGTIWMQYDTGAKHVRPKF